MQKPMAVRMKGKEKTNFQHNKKFNPHSLMASHLKEMEVTIRSLIATTTLMVPIVTSDSLEGLGLRPIPPNHPKGRLPIQAARKAETDF